MASATTRPYGSASAQWSRQPAWASSRSASSTRSDQVDPAAQVRLLRAPSQRLHQVRPSGPIGSPDETQAQPGQLTRGQRGGLESQVRTLPRLDRAEDQGGAGPLGAAGARSRAAGSGPGRRPVAPLGAARRALPSDRGRAPRIPTTPRPATHAPRRHAWRAPPAGRAADRGAWSIMGTARSRPPGRRTSRGPCASPRRSRASG